MNHNGDGSCLGCQSEDAIRALFARHAAVLREAVDAIAQSGGAIADRAIVWFHASLPDYAKRLGARDAWTSLLTGDDGFVIVSPRWAVLKDAQAMGAGNAARRLVQRDAPGTALVFLLMDGHVYARPFEDGN